MPRICYRDQNFRDSTLEVIEHAQSIVADYAAQGLSLTLRQLYYRFVASDMLPNTQKSYNRLGSIINDARIAGLIDWRAIEDRGRQLQRFSTWDNPGDLVRDYASYYMVDRWEGQPYRVEVWVEKQALEAVVGQAADEYAVPYFSCKGYTSQSEMWRAAQRFERYHEEDQQPVVIHLGDHDPSGIDMTRDIFDRLNALFDVDVQVERIALNMDQIIRHRPPPNPAKLSDSRAKAYIAQHGASSWELDALEPQTLNVLIQDTIEMYLDRELYDERLEIENEGSTQLAAIAAQFKANQ